MKSFWIIFAVINVVLSAPNQIKPHHSIDFNHFWTLDEINDYMTKLDIDYPQFTEIEVIGRTSENREIRAIRITKESTLTDDTPAIFITAALNSRDWIAAMSAVDIIHELVEHNYMFENLIDGLIWYILPVANPDGYTFSFTPENRNWAKNRRINPDSDCIGVNIDRNFNFAWGIALSSCVSRCCHNFRGPVAVSEEETRGIQQVIASFGRRLQAYVVIKAGLDVGSTIAFPFAHSNEAMLNNFEEHRAVSHIMAEAIYKSTGMRYQVGSEFNVVLPASGTSADYAAGHGKVPLVVTAFTPRGVDIGWDVPATRINDIVDEIFYGLEALGEYVKRNL